MTDNGANMKAAFSLRLPMWVSNYTDSDDEIIEDTANLYLTMKRVQKMLR